MAVEWYVKGHSVVIFGSNDLRDWVYNFRTMRTIGNNERVNRMDRKEALEVLRGIRGKLQGDMVCYVAGHSRGGAIAQIVARELARKGYEVRLETFGSKRTGNRRFVNELIWLTGWRAWRNRYDIVPFLPPWYARLPNRSTAWGCRGLIKTHTIYHGWNHIVGMVR